MKLISIASLMGANVYGTNSNQERYRTKEQDSDVLRYIAARVSSENATAPQFVVQVLREAIISGALESGQSIRQDQIAKELNTSKIPVREALRELEGQGLASFTPNKGFVVSKTSLEEMSESFKLRLMLEVFAVRESLPVATGAQLYEVEKIIDEYELVKDPMLTSYWNLKLHLALYEPAGMPHLCRMITRAHTVSQRYTHLYMKLRGEENETQDEHRAILAAYRARDLDLAADLMTDHISVACDRYTQFLAAHLSSGA
ncbi:GntR family transcriptional regulator [uncultured Ruegeria sp.]|uniref:GntR family transcriptional regulator n=1 Tax=uncultured Ruegeria sp. TaxID=259304 RepID=UPI00260AD5B0|nr:GntR family transcriptional regulator [uncultured Ruegeria sp.]